MSKNNLVNPHHSPHTKPPDKLLTTPQTPGGSTYNSKFAESPKPPSFASTVSGPKMRRFHDTIYEDNSIGQYASHMAQPIATLPTSVLFTGLPIHTNPTIFAMAVREALGGIKGHNYRKHHDTVPSFSYEVTINLEGQTPDDLNKIRTRLCKILVVSNGVEYFAKISKPANLQISHIYVRGLLTDAFIPRNEFIKDMILDVFHDFGKIVKITLPIGRVDEKDLDLYNHDAHIFMVPHPEHDQIQGKHIKELKIPQWDNHKIHTAWNPDPPCTFCFGEGHVVQRCPSLKGRICRDCGRMGHIAKKCRWNKKRVDDKEQTSENEKNTTETKNSTETTNTPVEEKAIETEKGKDTQAHEQWHTPQHSPSLSPSPSPSPRFEPKDNGENKKDKMEKMEGVILATETQKENNDNNDSNDTEEKKDVFNIIPYQKTPEEEPSDVEMTWAKGPGKRPIEEDNEEPDSGEETDKKNKNGGSDPTGDGGSDPEL